MEDRFFINDVCDNIINENQVILANKINGKWIKIPIECYKVIEYSIKNKKPLDKLEDVFNLDEDKKYYKQVVDKLEQLGFVSNFIVDKFKLERVNLVSFSPTNRCNLRCDYCCADSKIENKDYLGTEELKEAIDNIVKINPRILTITGGEPLLRDDFFEILSYTKEKFKGKIRLSTNATLIKENQVDEIIDGLYAMEISLDGYDELSCSKVRGKGVFTKVINLIKYIKSKGFNNIGLSMVVGKNNENDIDKFNKINYELGTIPIIRNFMNIGRGNESYTRYLDDELDIGYICEDDYINKNSLNSNMCKAGVNQISIDYKGDVYPCPNLEYDDLKMFNILQFDESMLEKILNRNMEIFDKFDILKPMNMEECKDCKVNVFCTTCPSKMYTLKNNKEMLNSNCKKMKSILEPIVW
ncbi:radical SAM/SPASM domain-containing protein [Clostridioides difficile]|uniref:Radical SAM protein n=10 Tax=Clostridioides difficile TaxID=1496 RepID=A0A9P3TYG1_CLODI|nr:radical SAM protein [Clostridioides difficile]AWH76406.1 radical SAM protein [Clostridioides difficile]AWH80182.1 radical SAM protein [Clostridioides difficile]AXU45272.1 radical SAM domain-containing protein [Clostridioides difficile]AXU63402.1 radical SAM domain-containing protein [Clostridioides difficile]EGT2216526.1 radical SAM protein [Clostridioides difficile]